LNFLPGHFKFQTAAVVKTSGGGAARPVSEAVSAASARSAHIHSAAAAAAHTQLLEFIRANAKVGTERMTPGESCEKTASASAATIDFLKITFQTCQWCDWRSAPASTRRTSRRATMSTSSAK